MKLSVPVLASASATALALAILTPTAALASNSETPGFSSPALSVPLIAATAVAGLDLETEISETPSGMSFAHDGIETSIPVNPSELASTSIDDRVHVGIGLGDEAKAYAGEVSPDGTTVFSNKDSRDAYTFQILDGGLLSATAVASSPKSDHRFVYDLSEGLVPVVQKTGAVALYDGDAVVGVVEHPQARDANGSDIASAYSIIDGDLVQTVIPTATTTYPLAATAKVGVFLTKGDYVHVTRGQASGHGWWVKGTTKATTAKVTVQLQYKPKKSSSWNNRGTKGVRTIKPGTSKRANARMTCRSSATKSWRSWVDVDLVGYLDTPNKLYTGARSLRCTV